MYLKPELVAFLHQLVGPRDQVQPVDVAEVVGDLRPEHPAGSPGVDGPVLDVFGIRPHQVAEGALVRDLNLPIDGTDLVDGLDLGAEAAVDAEDLVVDDGSQGQVVEDFSAIFPRIRVAILAVDLIVKAVDRRDLPGLVVPPQQCDPVGVLHLQAQQQLERLDRVVPPIDEISNEDVAGLVDFAT